MSHNDDLALVTACRDTLGKTTPGPWSLALAANPHDAALIAAAPAVTYAALSLIEDTLNRHYWLRQDDTGYFQDCGICADDIDRTRPCHDYQSALTALHAITVALLGAKE